MADYTKTKKNKINPFLWFLIAIVIPVVFAVILAYIIFSMAGVDATKWVKDKMSAVPVVSSFVTTEEEKDLEKQNEKLKISIKEKETEIEQLIEDVGNLEGVIDQLEKEVLKLEKKNTDNNGLDDDEEQNDDMSLRQMSQTFKDMDPEQAALIIQRLKNESAVPILNTLSNKVRGKIFEEMEPDQAAELTQLLIDGSKP